MGRSKFPGKPSKLVTKKRVSVLNGNNINNSGSSSGSQNAAAAATTTISNAFGAVGCTINDANNDIDADAETNQNCAVEQQSNNNIEPDSDIALRSTAAKCDVVQVNY